MIAFSQNDGSDFSFRSQGVVPRIICSYINMKDPARSVLLGRLLMSFGCQVLSFPPSPLLLDEMEEEEDSRCTS